MHAGDPEVAAAEAPVTGAELLERIERLSAQLALTSAKLKATEKRAEGAPKEREARRRLAREVERLRAVEAERDELREANAELARQLEGMWFQLRTAESRLAEAHDHNKRLFRRFSHRG